MRGALVLLALLAPAAALALDPPHDASNGITCESCHIPHTASGGALTVSQGNYNLCQSCHQSRGPAFGFAWNSGMQAVPGVSGSSHSWSGLAVNARFGTRTPLISAMAMRVTSGGYLQCSTCHDQHNGASLHHTGAQQHVSLTVGLPTAPTNNAGGAGRLTINTPAAGANPKGYLLNVEPGGTTFRLSHDNGTSWFGWSGSAWVANGAAGRPLALGTAVQLDDGANLTVTFGGTPVAGDRWKFYLSYPFLRSDNDTSQMCEDCHQNRVMTAAQIESGGDGVKEFSHPVSEALANPYDRATPLDANGAVQDSAGKDAILTNDLHRDAAGRVRCLTCHFPHGADSNSLTEDDR